MDFILATNNMKKLAEMQRILSPLGINVVTAKMLGVTLEDVEEDGETFEDNAKLKARAACKEMNMPAIADDSGLCVDYLNGAPGIFSARFAGEHGNDEKNNDLLLEKLDGVPLEKRTAHYVCAICCTFPDGREIVVRLLSFFNAFVLRSRSSLKGTVMRALDMTLCFWLTAKLSADIQQRKKIKSAIEVTHFAY